MGDEKGPIQSSCISVPQTARLSLLPNSLALSVPDLCLRFSLSFFVSGQSYLRYQEALSDPHSGLTLFPQTPPPSSLSLSKV